MELNDMDLEMLIQLYQTDGLDEALRAEVSQELQVRTANNQQFSREYLFRTSIVQNHALGLNFIPTTEAYSNYGPNITVAVSEDNNDLELLAQNLHRTPPVNTYGNIRLRLLVQNNLSKDQADSLENIGIDTSHIASVYHL